MSQKPSLKEFPEREEKACGMSVKIYGETSYQNQMAVLSHYLHNRRKDLDKDEQAEIVEAIREFLAHKELHSACRSVIRIIR